MHLINLVLLLNANWCCINISVLHWLAESLLCVTISYLCLFAYIHILTRNYMDLIGYYIPQQHHALLLLFLLCVCWHLMDFPKYFLQIWIHLWSVNETITMIFILCMSCFVFPRSFWISHITSSINKCLLSQLQIFFFTRAPVFSPGLLAAGNLYTFYLPFIVLVILIGTTSQSCWICCS